MLSGFVTALRTLTVLPVPGKDTETFSKSLFWFPVVGLLLGFLQAALGYSVHLLSWNELASVFVILGGITLTRSEGMPMVWPIWLMDSGEEGRRSRHCGL